MSEENPQSEESSKEAYIKKEANRLFAYAVRSKFPGRDGDTEENRNTMVERPDLLYELTKLAEERISKGLIVIPGEMEGKEFIDLLEIYLQELINMYTKKPKES